MAGDLPNKENRMSFENTLMPTCLPDGWKARAIACLFIALSVSSHAFAEIEVDANGNLVEFTLAMMSDGVKITSP